MDLRKLKTLVDLVSESNISELEITEADGKVRIVKFSPATPPVAYVPEQAAAAPISAVTALQGLRDRGRPLRAETRCREAGRGAQTW